MPTDTLTDLEAGFVQGLADAPEDDALRGVYADWLEENGQGERAHLMRWPLDIGGGVKVRFAAVPAGAFWMGGAAGRPGDRRAEIAAGFGLGIYPVTQEQWQAVMGANPSDFSRARAGGNRSRGLADADLRRLPVERVSWDDVQKFLARLNENQRDSGWLYRLPTEAEWECACRGAPSTREECAFSFYLDRPTNDLSSAEANFNGKYPAGKARRGPDLGRPSKVGSYRPNRLGLFDMHGNVWEWCQDAWGTGRVMRGGSWDGYGPPCQAAYRFGHGPAYRSANLGFRLARSPSAGRDGP
jgi:uncharacterized protein (TIGR02996 family)